MITRRRAIIALGAGTLSAPLAPFAQQQQKVYRVGILAPDTLASRGPLIEVFTLALRDLGYVEGKNLLIERRFADGDLSRLPALAAELVQQNVDVILAPNTPPAQAAKQATSTIPIVFASLGDPVGSGFVASLAHPGGNITGITNISNDLLAKQLQLLKEAFPKTSRVAVVVAGDPTDAVQYAEVQRAAKVLGVKVLSVDVRRRDDLENGIAMLRKWRADSIYALNTSTNFNHRKLLVEFAASSRLPAFFPSTPFVEDAGLMSYGIDMPANYRRAAAHVDKILKGTKPGDIPVELPTKFEFVINMKAAKALGVKFPQSILVQATKVIK